VARLEPVTPVHGAVLVVPDVHGDERGVFVETYRRSWFPEGREMVQGNRSDKQAGTVVGLHFHLHQADYWYVPAGRIRVVLHDLRSGSPTERGTATIDLDAVEHRGVWIPPGVAHGFVARTDATLTYLVDQYYNPADELGVAWDDPEIGADWGLGPAGPSVLSARDAANPSRAVLADQGRLPAYPVRT